MGTDSLSTVSAVLMFTLCSSSMLIVNKVAITSFPAPSALLFLQLFTSAAIIFVLSKAGILEIEKSFSTKDIKSYSVVSIAFLAALYTNIKILQHANIETFIVFRASTPILISMLDVVFLGRDIPSTRSFMSLMGLIAGATAYVYTDSKFEVTAYSWVIRWYVVFCIDQILIKHIVDSVKLTTCARSLLTNAIACVPVLVVVLVGRELEFVKSFSWSLGSVAVVFLSCLLGVLMSLSSFLLRSRVSATYFTVIGTMCKILSVFVNYFIWDKHATSWGLFALTICIFSALGYKQAGMRGNDDYVSSSKISKVTCAKWLLAAVCLGMLALVSRTYVPYSIGLQSPEEVEWCSKQLDHFHDDPSGLQVPGLAFTSQYHQDWLIYSSMLRARKLSGRFVDLASAWPKALSNSYFFEKCLGYDGLLIDADPKKVELAKKARSSKAINTCVTDTPMRLNMSSSLNHGGTGYVGSATIVDSRYAGVTVNEVQCQTLSSVLDVNGFYEVDFLSLDVEGFEQKVIKSIDFAKFKIHMIVAETQRTNITSDFDEARLILKKAGYVKVANLFVRLAVSSEPSGSDELYVLRHSPYFDDFKQWTSQVCGNRSSLGKVLKAMCVG